MLDVGKEKFRELKPFFNPGSVVVVGASRQKGSAGHVILGNLVENREKKLFNGEIYAVNPRADHVMGVKCYGSVREIERDEIDLAVIAVPAKAVPMVLKDCGLKGVKHAIIITSGFEEIGDIQLAEEVRWTASRYGVRIIGPNGLGVIDNYSGLDTSFIPKTKVTCKGEKVFSAPRPEKGFIALLSQSGAFGTAALDYMYGEGLGLSVFISYGNKMDVDETDLLLYLADDEKTRAILMYIESIERGREFMDAAKKTSKRKPIVALKAGRTKEGVRAAASHTAALAGTPRIYEAAFKQTGILVAREMEELFDLGKALAFQPPAQGNKVAILTNAGGPGVLATDASELTGLDPSRLPRKTLQRLRRLVEEKVIPPFSSILNPVDLSGSATVKAYVESMKVLLEEKEINGVILFPLHHPPAIESPEKLALELCKVIGSHQKPVVACKIGGSPMSNIVKEIMEKRFVPVYPSPERAVRAMKALVEYGFHLRRKRSFTSYMEKWRIFQQIRRQRE